VNNGAMKLRAFALALTIAVSGCLSLFAQNAPVHMLVSNGMKAVVQQLQPACERSIGHPLTIEFGSTTGLRQKIDMGSAFDVVMITSEAIADLAKEKRVLAGTSADLARSGVGFAVKAGAPKPDISTPEGLKRALREAKSITYAQDGASRPTLDIMFERLGLASELKPKIATTQGSGPAMANVASGQSAVVMTLISELMPVKGIEIVGPLPGDLQHYVNFAAAVGSKASDPAAAKAVIAFLRSASAAPAYKTNGMEPR
jgi:molybdate transport system substrate-binding protein